MNDNNEVSITDFEFVGGILFPDIISLNFNLSVDPDKERPVGAGDAQTAIGTFFIQNLSTQLLMSDLILELKAVTFGQILSCPFKVVRRYSRKLPLAV